MPSGILTATVDKPAVTREGTEDLFERTRVRGPGQNFRMSASAAAGTLFTTLRSILRSLTWTMIGLSEGRPFAAKIFATAFSSSAFAPRP
jgi:hypothetical protein